MSLMQDISGIGPEVRDQTAERRCPHRHEGAVGAGWLDPTELGTLERLWPWDNPRSFRGICGPAPLLHQLLVWRPPVVEQVGCCRGPPVPMAGFRERTSLSGFASSLTSGLCLTLGGSPYGIQATLCDYSVSPVALALLAAQGF